MFTNVSIIDTSGVGDWPLTPLETGYSKSLLHITRADVEDVGDQHNDTTISR